MINFDRVVPLAAKAAGDRPILAAPYPLPKVICDELWVQGVIGGYVADGRPTQASRDAPIAGWWIDRIQGSWFLRRSSSRTILFIGLRNDEEARRAVCFWKLV